MNKRLVWNFEFSTPNGISYKKIGEDSKSPIKWESRFFWPEDQTISLCLIDNELLDLSRYEQKHKDDCYFLVPDTEYNIKRRRNELLYKPILNKTPFAVGFGAKIDLENLDKTEKSTANTSSELKHILDLVRQKGIAIHVKKESFTFKFPTTPSIKLELARLEVHGKIYFSACIEGRSLALVQTISEHLLDKQVSCDYVSFLKNVQQ